ncbi:MAG: hypothetical protein R8G66_30325 [Cytophagales bacterium]|nr:hypothetical protein [Cytophagales bacterium]
MSRQIRFETYKGHAILCVNYSGLSETDMIQTLDQAAAIGMKENDLCILADFSKTRHSKLFNQKIKQHGLEYSKKGNDPRIAVLGIDSVLKRVIMNATMAVTRIRNVRLFETRERALGWLIS